MEKQVKWLFMLICSLMLVFNACQSLGNTYEVNQSKCTGCAKCAAVCGHGAITISGGKATISSSRCVGCGRCVQVCSYSAISLSN